MPNSQYGVLIDVSRQSYSQEKESMLEKKGKREKEREINVPICLFRHLSLSYISHAQRENERDFVVILCFSHYLIVTHLPILSLSLSFSLSLVSLVVSSRPMLSP